MSLLDDITIDMSRSRWEEDKSPTQEEIVDEAILAECTFKPCTSWKLNSKQILPSEKSRRYAYVKSKLFEPSKKLDSLNDILFNNNKGKVDEIRQLKECTFQPITNWSSNGNKSHMIDVNRSSRNFFERMDYYQKQKEKNLDSLKQEKQERRIQLDLGDIPVRYQFITFYC